MDNLEALKEKDWEPSDDSESGQILEILLNTREQCQMMENLIKSQIEVKDDRINKLHKELEYYKQESADRFADQLMKAVIKVRKDMVKLIASEKWDEMSREDLQREYTYIFEDLTDLLEQQNIDPYKTNPGEAFDASIHQPTSEATDRPELDKTIKESLAEGYKKPDKVLIPERVVVYKYKENTKEIL